MEKSNEELMTKTQNVNVLFWDQSFAKEAPKAIWSIRNIYLAKANLNSKHHTSVTSSI